MVKKELLKTIFFLKDLPDHIVEKIGKIAQTQDYDTDHVIYKQDEVQTIFYMLVSGKILLTSKSHKGLSVTLDTVLPGRIFGVPALLNDSKGALTAICAEPCTLITLSGKKMRQMFTKDFEVGHTVMQKLVEMYKLRRDMHTQQFLHSLKIHPEIQKFEA